MVYRRLPSPGQDTTEVVSAATIAVVPNVHHPFDPAPAVEMHPDHVQSPVRDYILDLQTDRRILEQGYFVEERVDRVR